MGMSNWERPGEQRPPCSRRCSQMVCLFEPSTQSLLPDPTTEEGTPECVGMLPGDLVIRSELVPLEDSAVKCSTASS